jgi:hypothetical protein
MTDFTSMCNILGELYFNYKDQGEMDDFIDFNDLGLPLAYLASENLCQVSDDGAKYIIETWTLFLETLQLQDTGWDSLDEILDSKADKKDGGLN